MITLDVLGHGADRARGPRWLLHRARAVRWLGRGRHFTLPGRGPNRRARAPSRRRWLQPTRRRLIILTLLVGLAALLLDNSGVTPGQGALSATTAEAALTSPVLPQYAIQSADVVTLRNSVAVARAVQFILDLQPTGTYVLSHPGVDDVVPMDVAHSAIALAKIGYVAEARSAMTWLLSRMTVPGDPDELGVYSEGDAKRTVDYAGSWWDHFRASGVPRTDQTRGRAEGVGIALIATYVVYLEEPSFLAQSIGPYTVADRVGFAAGYLSSPAIQRDDGRFNHRPDYRVSFNEEGARMVTGLQLAAEMLDSVGRTDEAARLRSHADLGLTALLRGKGINQGMAYDYYALGIWGLGTPQRARQELTSFQTAGLTTSYGVRNWDWQLHQATNLFDRVRWWAQAQTIAPSETFDWAIASITAGQPEIALQVESKWLGLQLPDGGFPGGYLPVLGLSFGPPASYSAARFVVLERLLTEAIGSGTELAKS